MFTADQIVAHLVGDYLLQSHWMATEKTKRSYAAAAHAITYAAPFLWITLDPWALAAIVGSHFVIDRYRLARFVVWAKNGFNGPVTATGYPDDTPPWLAVWLLIIADNTLHLLCNGLILTVVAAC
jgi:hypothetical protein